MGFEKFSQSLSLNFATKLPRPICQLDSKYPTQHLYRYTCWFQWIFPWRSTGFKCTQVLSKRKVWAFRWVRTRKSVFRWLLPFDLFSSLSVKAVLGFNHRLNNNKLLIILWFQPCYYARYELKEYSSTKSYSVRIESCWSNF